MISAQYKVTWVFQNMFSTHSTNVEMGRAAIHVKNIFRVPTKQLLFLASDVYLHNINFMCLALP